MNIKNLKLLWGALILIIAVEVSSSLYLFQFSQDQIVYVDNARLLNNYQGMLDARKAFENKVSVWQANIDSLSSEVMETLKDHEKEVASLTVKEKALSEQLIQTKQQQLKNYQQAIQRQSAEEDAKMTEQVLTTVNAFLSSYGEDHHYEIIMGANASGNIIYAKNGLDITDEVLEALNDQYV
ncbi:MAG: OmpH family outer membrane protein, partial [Bacteroidota bacterium]